MLWEEMDVLFIKAEERGFHLSHLERKKKKKEMQREEQTGQKPGFIISILLMKKLRTREVKPVAQGHSAFDS